MTTSERDTERESDRETWRAAFESRRWYGDKGRPLSTATTVDSVTGAPWSLLELRFDDIRDGDASATYQLARVDSGSHAPAAGASLDAPDAADFAAWVLGGIDAGRVETRAGGAIRFDASRPLAAPEQPELVRAEMSNTLVRWGEVALKIYRRLARGAHPEPELLAWLAARDFPYAPRLDATARYGRGDVEAALMLVMEFIDVESTLWEVFTRSEDDDHLVALAAELGRVTADLHAALAAMPVGGATHAGVAGDARGDLETLEREASRAPALERVLSRRRDIEARVARGAAPSNRPIRIHGDYHLGQLVVERSGRLVVLDFEGEPALPLAARSVPRPAARDIACMLRSFSYARRCHAGGERSADWESRLRETFLSEYLGRADGADGFLPASPSEWSEAVVLYELQKALAETVYELRNRPARIAVPAGAVEEILSRGN